MGKLPCENVDIATEPLDPIPDRSGPLSAHVSPGALKMPTKLIETIGGYGIIYRSKHTKTKNTKINSEGLTAGLLNICTFQNFPLHGSTNVNTVLQTLTTLSSSTPTAHSKYQLICHSSSSFSTTYSHSSQTHQTSQHRNTLPGPSLAHLHWSFGFLALTLPQDPNKTNFLTALSNHPVQAVRSC